MPIKHTHPNDCTDTKAAAADRKAHAVASKAREERAQILAHTAWFDWYAPHPPK
jgi:hypothetical protein